eukprot:3671731-Rhodomonas_salina.2
MLFPRGLLQVGRVNLGRDKGLGTRLMARKESTPSVAVWDGEEEVRVRETEEGSEREGRREREREKE